jgi:hypothetical protein
MSLRSMSVALTAVVHLAIGDIEKRLRIAATVNLSRGELRVHEVLYLLDRFVLGKLVRVGNSHFLRDVVVYLLLDDAVKGFHLV